MHGSDEDLEKGERRFRHLAESLPLIVWTANADGAVDYQTRAVLDYTGRSSQELTGAGWLEALHPDDREPTVSAWTRSVESGDPYEVQFRLLRRDGEYRWHLCRAVRVRNGDEPEHRWYGSAMDIHDQLDAESRAHLLAERLTVTLEGMSDAFCLLDPGWRFVFLNREAERLLGRPETELLGGSIWERFPELVGTALEEAFREAASTEETGVIEFQPPGSSRWLSFRAHPSSEGLALYFRDVSSDKETRLRLHEQAHLLDRAQDAIIVHGFDHRIVYWNAGAERIYGWTRAEVEGRSLRDLLYDEVAPLDAAMASLLDQGEWTGELEQRRKDGVRVLVEARWSLTRPKDGGTGFGRILAIHTDVTKRSKLLAQYYRAQRMESIGTLAGGIAHDLNNVLAPILLSIGMLKEEAQDLEQWEILSTIEQSARRGAQLVSQVLAFSRGVEGAHLPVDLTQVLDDVGRAMRGHLPRNIEVKREIPDDLWLLEADPAQIHQAFMHLFANAREAMPTGGTITVSAENVELDTHYAAMSGRTSPGPHVRINVTDTGSGIPEEIIDRIFDPFFTTKEVGLGTGLGLSTVSSIVRSHAGVVNAYSEPGRGTTFRLYLPARSRSGAYEEQPDVEERRRGNGELILVVDDECSVREITRQTLEAFGYRVVTATDGADAAAAFGRAGGDVAVVLTDLSMPIMDGPTTIRALRRMDPKVRIVAASGLGGGGAVDRVAQEGVRHFLPKPYTADQLLDKIHEMLTEDTAR